MSEGETTAIEVAIPPDATWRRVIAALLARHGGQATFTPDELAAEDAALVGVTVTAEGITVTHTGHAEMPDIPEAARPEPPSEQDLARAFPQRKKRVVTPARAPSSRAGQPVTKVPPPPSRRR